MKNFIKAKFSSPLNDLVEAGTTTKNWNGDATDFIMTKQIHSNRVAVYPTDFPTNTTIVADAILCDKKGVTIACRTADCLPLLLADSQSDWIGVVHAGWKGIRDGVIGNTLRKLIKFGVDIKTISVWIGPHIAYNSFEVSMQVADNLLSGIPQSELFDGHSYATSPVKGKQNVNLFALAFYQLQSYGCFDVRSSMIDTFSSVELCFSHRRKDIRRHYSIIRRSF